MDSIPFGIEGYELVRATPDDMDFIMECMAGTILDSVPKDEKDLRDLWIDDILQIISNNMIERKEGNEVFKLVSENGYAGMLWMGVSKDQFTCDDTGYLLGIFVKKELRGQGLGKELMRAAERWCGINHLITLTLNVGAVNEVAIGLYKKMGYADQSIVMRRHLR